MTLPLYVAPKSLPPMGGRFTTIGEQALWSWRGVIKKFARGGVIKFFFRVGLEGGSTKIFLLLISAF